MVTRKAMRVTTIGALISGVGLWSGASWAQSDVSPPLPNVLIILDNSGSMERMTDGTLPTKDDSTALTAGTTASVAKNRWITAVEVIAGSISGYRLLAEDRSSSDFKNEFGLGGKDPYDASYGLLHYRPLSSNCAIGSNSLAKTATWPDNWLTYGPASFGARQWNGSTLGAINSGCSVSQFDVSDGLGVIQTYSTQARFALMTFDNATSSFTGYASGTHLGHEVEGMTGLWSYFPGWDGTSPAAPQYGWPSTCTDTTPLSDHIFEVGARNPSAPPWEGALVPFATDDSKLSQTNQLIRDVVLATRPYGATPIAPTLADAEYYFWNDPNGPKKDPQASCRGDFIILVTDGFPNEDIRDTSPNCENSSDPKAASVWPACNSATGGGGCCPSKRAIDIAEEMATSTDSTKPPVKTFVVGFALSDDTGKPVNCADPAVDPVSGSCSTMAKTDPRYPCCTMNQIAFKGGTGTAFVASSADTLRAALQKAMAAATASTDTSRTLPVFTSALNGGSASQDQFEFRSSFTVNAFSSWQGKLERVRYQCLPSGGGGLKPTQVPFDAAAGDDFAGIVNAAGTSRNVFTWDGRDASTSNTSSDTIRANATSSLNDGLSKVKGVPVAGSSVTTFVGSVAPDMMGITTATLTTSCKDAADIYRCRDKYLKFDLGVSNAPYFDRVGNAFADIGGPAPDVPGFEASPIGVGVPSDFLRDESYADFRRIQSGRVPMLVVATNDGILHGFQTNKKDTTNSELWAFILPAVLPKIPSFYPGAHLPLLGMSPVVKDVAFGTIGSSTPWGRTRDEAKGGRAQWRTVAVGGLTAGGGYYAIDITDPAAPAFLWQITTIKDTSGKLYNLFGTAPSPPAIGTVFYAEPGQNPIETPVAILPGGHGNPSTTSKLCPRWVNWSIGERGSTQCYGNEGESLTIVRLWDGKVLRSFRNDPTGGAVPERADTTSPVYAWQTLGAATTVVGAYAGIDSPISGAVAIYPGAVGSVTTRIFVGDSDGDLWHVDTTDKDPLQWKLRLFADAHHGLTYTVGGDVPQPVSVAPVITVDPLGNVTTVFATGNQNAFSTSNRNHVLSVREKIDFATTPPSTSPVVNWQLDFNNGITPTGPLSLFSGNVYFSTFQPDVSTGSACLKGQGTIWGVDYFQTEPGTTPALPLARLQQQSGESIAGSCPGPYANADARTGMGIFFRCIPLDPGTIVFGSGITQRPSCVDTASTATTDPYLGGSMTHATISDINAGQFQLVAQTGPKAGSKDTAGTSTKTFTRQLVPPVSVTRIDSWAAVIE